MTSVYDDDEFSEEEPRELTEEEISEQVENFYVTLATSIQTFADNTRKAVSDFEFSRQDLVRVSLAVDMMANSLNLLRNYVNFYIDEVDPHKYNTLYTEMNGLADIGESYNDDEALAKDLQNLPEEF